MEYLEKIDIIRERLNVSYEEAHQALEENDGDLVQALIKLEKKEEQTRGEGIDSNKFKVKGQELIDKIKDLIKEGNVSKISVKSKDKTIVEIPVTAGVVSLIIFPYITILGGLAAMMKEYTLEIDREKNKDNGEADNMQNHDSDEDVY